jgi:hypothetical protein
MKYILLFCLIFLFSCTPKKRQVKITWNDCIISYVKDANYNSAEAKVIINQVLIMEVKNPKEIKYNLSSGTNHLMFEENKGYYIKIASVWQDTQTGKIVDSGTRVYWVDDFSNIEEINVCEKYYKPINQAKLGMTYKEVNGIIWIPLDFSGYGDDFDKNNN